MRAVIILLLGNILLTVAFHAESNPIALSTFQRIHTREDPSMGLKKRGKIRRRIQYPENRFSQNPTDLKRLFDQTKTNRCNGKENLLEDIGSLAIISGSVGTVMGIFSASYFSVTGNIISIISTIISWATAIPSAVITYLATTDRFTYALANFLSVVGFANTLYGKWSIDFGNADIFTSQVANVVGIFSLILSLISGFPDIFDSILEGLRYLYGTRVVDRYVAKYRCDGKDFWDEMASLFQ